jgi:hypothetical protein
VPGELFDAFALFAAFPPPFASRGSPIAKKDYALHHQPALVSSIIQ